MASADDVIGYAPADVFEVREIAGSLSRGGADRDGRGNEIGREDVELLRAEDFEPEAIEEALRVALVDGLGLKPRVAFGALRVAVSGRRVSPPLFESMELLGRERSLGRLRAALA